MINSSKAHERKEKRAESREITIGESVHHRQLAMNFNIVSRFKTQTRKKVPVIEKVSQLLYIRGKVNDNRKEKLRKKREKLRENLRETYNGGEMCERDKRTVFRNFMSSFIEERLSEDVGRNSVTFYAAYKKKFTPSITYPFVSIAYHEFSFLQKLIGTDL